MIVGGGPHDHDIRRRDLSGGKVTTRPSNAKTPAGFRSTGSGDEVPREVSFSVPRAQAPAIIIADNFKATRRLHLPGAAGALMVRLSTVGIVVTGMLTLATRVSPFTLTTPARSLIARRPPRTAARLRSLGMTITTKPTSAGTDADADAAAPLPAPISDEQRLTRFADSIALLRGPRLVSAAVGAANAEEASTTVVKRWVTDMHIRRGAGQRGVQLAMPMRTNVTPRLAPRTR